MYKLAVVVQSVEDQRLIARLLPARSYHFFEKCEWLSASNKEFRSIIVCHRISQQVPVPDLPASHLNSRIIVLSDTADEKVIIDTLSAGARHFFDLRESEWILEARIGAALTFHAQRESSILDVEPYIFYVDSRTVIHGKRKLDLSPREFELAYYLFLNRGRVVSNSELMTSVWSLPASLDTRRIDTSICSVRKKMNLNDANSKWKILRLRQTGYKVRCESS